MPDRPVYSVAGLTLDLKALLEAHFDDVWVEGEISNFRKYASGHCYFTLKDAEAQVSCVLWRGLSRYLFFSPQDGMQVLVHGEVSVYEKRGEYQIVVRSMQPAGEGALRQAFEQLKKRLAEEGLFDERHKQPLPPFPQTIGIVTSGDGAALRDVLAILNRRFPAVQVLVCPVRVQGAGAAEEIATAIDAFNALEADDPLRPDLLIVGRGGGSVEDLWAFNEEIVARSLFACRIPTISAVGHEVDFTIADFVADVRAATPSMAAELAVPDRRELLPYIEALHVRSAECVLRRLADYRQRVQRVLHAHAFNRPVDQFRQTQQRLDELTERLHRAARRTLTSEQQRITFLQQRLHTLDPTGPLRRGYAKVERHGQSVHNASELHPGDPVLLHFLDGTREAEVL